MSARSENRYAAERYDVLEDDVARGICGAPGCNRGQPVYPIAGAFGTYYVCSRHRAIYRDHERIVTRIRKFQDREIVI